MKIYDVFRVGKCVKCGQNVREKLGVFKAETKEEAIRQAQSRWSFDNFGQAGAMRENEILEEEKFLSTEFITEESDE